MSKTKLSLFVFVALLFSARAFAIDGQVLINQSTVEAAGGFPYKITQSGSYKLSGNLVVSAANTDGIDIEVNNVTIDLDGFTIQGPVTCSGAGASLFCPPLSPNSHGVSASTGNVTVQNGVVAGFVYGVYLPGPGANNRVLGMTTVGNAIWGIVINQGVVRNSVASFNEGGIACTQSCSITSNQLDFNRLVGLSSFFPFGTVGGLFGNNEFTGNGVGDFAPTGMFDQGNNACNGSAC
jgi:hypothetical protein